MHFPHAPQVIQMWEPHYPEIDQGNIKQDIVDAWRRQWHPTPVLSPGKSHGRRSLGGCSPWGLEESDMTERLHFHSSLPCFGEGNGNPLQCSCLENPRDGGAWWAAVYGVAQSRTRLKRLGSSRQQQQVMLVVKNLSANAGDMVSMSGSGRSPGGGHGNPLQYSRLESPMDRGARQSTGLQRVSHN